MKSLVEREATLLVAIDRAEKGKYDFKNCATRKGKVCIEDVAAALFVCKGLITDAAALLGVNRSRISRAVTESVELLDILKEQREIVVDLAEKRLFEAVDDGEAWAVKEVLKSLGANRGYGNKVEVTNVTLTANEILDNVDYSLDGVEVGLAVR